MKFTYDGADLSKTIETYEQTENNYLIKYLDKSEAKYTSNNPDEENKLQELMLQQAIERDTKMQISVIEIKKNIFKIMALFSSYISVISYEKRNYVLAILSWILTGLTVNESSTNVKQIKELKKYQIFIEMINELKLFNESEILKCIEFDNVYQQKLNINTIDQYSFGQMKRIRKHLNKLLNEKNGE